MAINLHRFNELAKAQEKLKNMKEGQEYAVQYRIPGEREFSDIDPDPSDIRTLQDAEKRFQVDNGKSGTEVRLVKVSRYLTLDGRLAIQNVLRYRIVR